MDIRMALCIAVDALEEYGDIDIDAYGESPEEQQEIIDHRNEVAAAIEAIKAFLNNPANDGDSDAASN